MKSLMLIVCLGQGGLETMIPQRESLLCSRLNPMR